MENKFDFRKIGSGYLFCFNSECPKSGECLRYAAGRQIPAGVDTGSAVLPPAFQGKACRYYKSMEIVEYAYGFEHIYDHVLRKHYTGIRKDLTAYLGNRGRYYDYKHGKIGLSPEQRQYIKDTFARYGYDADLCFDRYEQQYDY